jgi:hypothetical protein
MSLEVLGLSVRLWRIRQYSCAVLLFSYSDSGTEAGKLRFEDMLVLGH